MHWDGRSWSAVPTPNPWPECQDGDILWSDGATWREVTVAGGSSGELTSVSATGPNDVWAVGSTGSGNLIEHFDGNGWSVRPSPQPGSGSSLESVSAL